MDMDMQYGSTWSVETLYIPYISIWTWLCLHVHILSLLHTLDIKIDLFKIGTMLFIIIQGF